MAAESTDASLARAATGAENGALLSGVHSVPDFHRIKAEGASFVFLDATTGTTPSPNFQRETTGAIAAEMIHGAYAVGRPKQSSGAAQAGYLLSHGGSWTADGLTLPPALEMEHNPDGSACYDLSHAAMVRWISDFANTIHQATTRYPIIITTANWWNKCTGDSQSFGSTSPLLAVHWGVHVGALPAGWSSYTFWEHADSGRLPGQQIVFNGNLALLLSFARGG